MTATLSSNPYTMTGTLTLTYAAGAQTSGATGTATTVCWTAVGLA